MPVITNEIFIKAPIEKCFDLARNVDIHAKTVSKTKERVVGGVTAGLLELGDVVTFEAVHFGVKQRLTAKVTKMEKPSYFVDEMLCGAFKSFVHTHEFQAINNGTLMIDHFNYTSPFGVVGTALDKLFLEKYMKAFITGRSLELKRIAEEESS
jgi:ligand-binding SRPBCC domain-containing protein